MAFEPLPQQLFELLLEAVRAGKSLKCGLELAFACLEPLAPERLECIELDLSLPAALSVGGRDRRIRSLAKD